MDKLNLKLFIGDKHLSSWSMRPWLLMKQFEIPFKEELIQLDKENTKIEISKISPSAKVPVLVDNDVSVWDSLAIAEYLAEKFPRLALWPDSTKQRAWARSICAEMHSGFAHLRKECFMDLLTVHPSKQHFSKEAEADVLRIDEIFQECRVAHKSKGNYLFGEFGIADAYYMPIISRFRTYGMVPAQGLALDYYHFIVESPLFNFWLQEAGKAMK